MTERKKHEARLDRLAELIAFTSPRADSHAIADRLMMTHCSMNTVYESRPDDLTSTTGVTRATAGMISMIPQLARYCLREDALAFGAIRDYKRAGAFLKTLYIGLHIECFYMLCLDENGMRIDCPLIQRGTVNEAPFYARLMLEHAVRLGAHAIVLSHNHPSGQLTPSASDLSATITTIHDLRPLGIRVLDHILVADNDFISFRARRLIADGLFLEQAPDDTLLAHWLKPQNTKEE